MALVSIYLSILYGILYGFFQVRTLLSRPYEDVV